LELFKIIVPLTVSMQLSGTLYFLVVFEKNSYAKVFCLLEWTINIFVGLKNLLHGDLFIYCCLHWKNEV